MLSFDLHFLSFKKIFICLYWFFNYHIIKIYNVIDTQHSLHLIMEYVPFISLSDYMKSKNGKTLDEQ